MQATRTMRSRLIGSHGWSLGTQGRAMQVRAMQSRGTQGRLIGTQGQGTLGRETQGTLGQGTPRISSKRLSTFNFVRNHSSFPSNARIASLRRRISSTVALHPLSLQRALALHPLSLHPLSLHSPLAPHIRVRGISSAPHPLRSTSHTPLDLPDLGPLSGLKSVEAHDKVYVAMSGGVDSSTVAALLARMLGKHRIVGVFMNNWSSQARCQESSWRAVQQICRDVGIACRRIDLERDYWSDVFEPMLQAYQRGLTPNPDVGCNRHIKFGMLVNHLKQADPEFKWIATGHYAGVHRLGSGSLVHRAAYMPKDQSYYLATVDPQVLGHVLFPLAHLAKPKVREWAARLGLVDVASKPDSQGLCFVEQQHEVGARGFRKFLAEYLVDSPGPFVLAEDPQTVVGQHRGLWSHTIGQRASVAMPQSSPHTRGQWFVVAKDVDRNALVIDRGVNADRLFVDHVVSTDFQWHVLPSSNTLFAQYRSLQEPGRLSSWTADDQTEFTFTDRRRAVAPGQYIVVYENGCVIGAGTITSANRV